MGMTIREIQGHLLSCTAPKYRLPLISAVTDAVIEDMKAWQSRSLESLYPMCRWIKSFPEAIEAVYPKTTIQLCIVHLVRYPAIVKSWQRNWERIIPFFDYPRNTAYHLYHQCYRIS